MTWNVNPTITVAGVEYTNLTFNQVSIDYGRSKIFDTPRPGYARLDIVNLTNTAYPFKINDSLVIELENTASTDVTVFTGIITDVKGSFRNSDSADGVGVITLTAVAPMAQMSRVVVGSTVYPSETDAARINRILTEAGVTIDVVDSAIYTFSQRPVGLTDAYTLANNYAMSVLGSIYETTDGKVGYANESRRRQEAITNGFTSIPNSSIIINSINSNENIADVMNLTNITYTGGTVSDFDATSQSTYGVIGASFNTELADASDAQTIAGTYINMRAVPRKSLSSFSIRLLDPTLTNSLVNTLLDVYFGMPIEVPGLPNSIVDVDYEGYVEGWNLTFSPANAVLTLKTSQEAYSYRDTRWQDVDPLTEWDDIDPTATRSTKTNLITNPTFEPVDYGALGYLPTTTANTTRINFADTVGDISGDVDVRIQLSLDDYTPTGTQGWLFKESGTTNRSWRWTITTAGILQFVWWPLGTSASALTMSATTATGITDGSIKWLRFTMDVDNGAGQRVGRFFTSDDALNWTQLGSTITTAGTTSIFNSTADLTIGYGSNSGVGMNGKIYAVSIRDGIDGNEIFAMNVAGNYKPTDGFTFTSTTGQSGTIQNSVAVVYGWSTNTGTTIAKTTQDAYKGCGSVLNTVTVAGTNRGMFNPTGFRIPVTAGTQYTGSVYVKDINTSANFRPTLLFYTAVSGGSLISSNTGTTITPSTTSWTRMSVTGTAPVGAVAAALFPQNITSAALGTQFLFDAAMLETGATASTYFDGFDSDIPANQYPALAWTGTQQESSSTGETYWSTLPTTLWNNVDEQGIP